MRQHQHPYISAMVNNGSLHYDHDRDGTHTQLAGCEAKFRNLEHDTHIAIRYERNTLTGTWNQTLKYIAFTSFISRGVCHKIVSFFILLNCVFFYSSYSLFVLYPVTLDQLYFVSCFFYVSFIIIFLDLQTLVCVFTDELHTRAHT